MNRVNIKFDQNQSNGSRDMRWNSIEIREISVEIFQATLGWCDNAFSTELHIQRQMIDDCELYIGNDAEGSDRGLF
jgi:hypothetical protein